MLDNLVKESKVSHNKFKCSTCSKILNSRAAIVYHVRKVHILKKTTNENMWVSNQVKTGKREKHEGASVKYEWHCSMCENKIYPSHQGLRAHMKSHYAKLFNSDNDKDFIDMLSSSLGAR